MSTKIANIDAVQILDSRGNPTVAVLVQLDGGAKGIAGVPSGASTGEFEAVELRDGDQLRYRGKGVTRAVQNVRTVLKEALIGRDALDQRGIDNTLIALDGTDNKSKLGANALLGVSLAVAHAAAAANKQEFYEYLAIGSEFYLPVPLVNVINGGAHANNSLDIQEFMIVPHGAPTFAEAIRMSAEIFHSLGSLLKNDGYDTGVGDEGGYAPRLESLDLAFEFLLRAIEKAGYIPGEQIALALDVAASEFVDESDGKVTYRFAKSGAGTFTSSELVSLYEKWIQKYPLVSIEDGLGENDWAGWKELTSRLGASLQLVGDDLFVTNTKRIQRGISENIGNSVLIKVNQIGTLSETLDAVSTGKKAGYTSIMSHRSGETCDSTISDLAVALSTQQIKTGSMCRGERTEKYNRLLWIEHLLGSKAKYESPFRI